jgi:hypothetical protein
LLGRCRRRLAQPGLYVLTLNNKSLSQFELIVQLRFTARCQKIISCIKTWEKAASPGSSLCLLAAMPGLPDFSWHTVPKTRENITIHH